MLIYLTNQLNLKKLSLNKVRKATTALRKH